MTTETNAPAPTTESAPVETVEAPVLKPNTKPYDDDFLETYGDKDANENNATEPPAAEPSTEAPKEEPKEETETPPKEEAPKEEQNFEATKITKEINGKEVEFTVADAIKSHMAQEEFNRNMDRRVTSVAKREKAFADSQANLQGKIKGVMDIARQGGKGGLIPAIRALAKLAAGESNLDVVEFEKAYFKDLDKTTEVYSKMTQEQRDAYWAKREAEEAKEEASKIKAKTEAQEGITALQNDVAALQKEHGVPEDEFWSTYKNLLTNATGEGKRFATKEDILPENVIGYALLGRHNAKVAKACAETGIDNPEILKRISNITMSDPDLDLNSLTVDDIKEVIKNSGIALKASPQAVENLNRKAEKSNIRFNQASSTKKANGIVEGYDSESLDFLYRNTPKAVTRITR